MRTFYHLAALLRRCGFLDLAMSAAYLGWKYGGKNATD